LHSRPDRVKDWPGGLFEAGDPGVESMFEERFVEEHQLGSERKTGGRTITETAIVIHAGQTGEFYPHHMDAEWCKT
jgi:acyl dehydratase